MHAIIFAELKKFAESIGGPGTWTAICESAGLAARPYATFGAFGAYPDEEAVRLVTAASRLTGVEPQRLLADFGEFIAPDLIELYKHRIDAGWSCLDLLLNTEQTIHEVLRAQDAAARPPRLRVERTGPREVLIAYDSPRKMCAVAKGIVRGLGKAYGETIEVREESCMLQGAPQCTLRVTAA